MPVRPSGSFIPGELIATVRSSPLSTLPRAFSHYRKHSDLLRPGLRVLDADCGFGVITFAFLEALRRRDLDYKSIDAFDLTPAMLHRFQKTLEFRGISRVQLRQADLLALGTLPAVAGFRGGRVPGSGFPAISLLYAWLNPATYAVEARCANTGHNSANVRDSLLLEGGRHAAEDVFMPLRPHASQSPC